MTRVAAWLSWFAALLVLWLVLVGTVQDVERIAGLCAAALGASAVVPDFFVVLSALVRPTTGRFRTVEFPTGGTRDVDAGRRAFIAIAPSLAPNSLVVDADRESGEVLVHDLVPGAASPGLP
jgi:multisubunit Na+/H+ antiporter MnhE subunit